MRKINRRRYDPQQLSQFKDLDPALARVYVSRGIKSQEDLDKDIKSLLPYHQLKGIEQAVQCISSALVAQKRIVIVGDYDADGATSSAVAVQALSQFGAKNVFYCVPNRFEYGYGLSPEIVELAVKKYMPDLIITVDNGIASCDGVAAANKLGIPVVITDHHLAGEKLPEAAAIVNPNQPGDEFPSKNLAGVGVIFYVMCALRRYLIEHDWFTKQQLQVPKMIQFLDLVALGTVADLVPLDKNNRIMVEQGLRRIRGLQTRYGLLALLEVSKKDIAHLLASDLGFSIGPRLNAAGRLDDMAKGIECLLSEDYKHAFSIATELDVLNQRRRHIEKDMHQQAVLLVNKIRIKQDDLPMILCLYEAHWHQGVIGILASRIKDRVHRPVIAFARVSEQEIKGSARSIPGLHIRDVLAAVATHNPGLITKFGGHAMAAGLSLLPENLDLLREKLENEVKKHLSLDQLEGQILTDGKLMETDLNLKLAETISEGGPWGQQFPEPIFDGEFNIIDQRIVGKNHLKLLLGVPDSQLQVNAIAFQVDEERWPNQRARRVTAAYRLTVNRFRGISSLQLIIEDFDLAKSQN